MVGEIDVLTSKFYAKIRLFKTCFDGTSQFCSFAPPNLIKESKRKKPPLTHIDVHKFFNQALSIITKELVKCVENIRKAAKIN